MENKLLTAALWYAKIGWWVFPTREKEGKPYIKDGVLTTPREKSPYIASGFKGSTNSLDKVREFWKKFPEAGIGVDCGRSGLFVVDVDNHGADGEGDGYKAWMILGIPTNGAWIASTPNRGSHYIFSGSGKSTQGRIDRNIDTRSNGGYFIAPPSYIYENGIKKYYTAENKWSVSSPPMKISPKDYDKLFPEKKRKPSNKTFPKNIDYDFRRVKKIIENYPVEPLYSHQKWVEIGMALKNEFGESGFPLWELVTDIYLEDKPSSSRTGTLERKWRSFVKTDNGLKIGTIVGHSKIG